MLAYWFHHELSWDDFTVKAKGNPKIILFMPTIFLLLMCIICLKMFFTFMPKVHIKDDNSEALAAYGD